MKLVICFYTRPAIKTYKYANSNLKKCLFGKEIFDNFMDQLSSTPGGEAIWTLTLRSPCGVLLSDLATELHDKKTGA